MVSIAEPQSRNSARLDSPTFRETFHRNVNLTLELALTQFKLKYTGSILGYVWSLIKPLMLFSVMWIVFEKLFKTGRNSENFTMQLLLAIVTWSFFQEATSTAMSSIAGNGHIIRKAYFPRWILVISSTFAALLTFAINFALILVITIPLGQLQIGVQSLIAPLFLLELYALVVGASLILSSLFVFYRDMGHIWEIFSQVLFYGSTVVYPFSLIGNSTMAHLVAMNPMAQIIEDLRHSLVTPHVKWTMEIAGGWLYLVPLLIVVSILVGGSLLFRRLSPRFAEYL